jgi:hypothetical protein
LPDVCRGNLNRFAAPVAAQKIINADADAAFEAFYLIFVWTLMVSAAPSKIQPVSPYSSVRFSYRLLKFGAFRSG